MQSSNYEYIGTIMLIFVLVYILFWLNLKNYHYQIHITSFILLNKIKFYEFDNI